MRWYPAPQPKALSMPSSTPTPCIAPPSTQHCHIHSSQASLLQPNTTTSTCTRTLTCAHAGAARLTWHVPVAVREQVIALTPVFVPTIGDTPEARIAMGRHSCLTFIFVAIFVVALGPVFVPTIGDTPEAHVAIGSLSSAAPTQQARTSAGQLGPFGVLQWPY